MVRSYELIQRGIFVPSISMLYMQVPYVLYNHAEFVRLMQASGLNSNCLEQFYFMPSIKLHSYVKKRELVDVFL